MADNVTERAKAGLTDEDFRNGLIEAMAEWLAVRCESACFKPLHEQDFRERQEFRLAAAGLLAGDDVHVGKDTNPAPRVDADMLAMDLTDHWARKGIVRLGQEADGFPPDEFADDPRVVFAASTESVEFLATRAPSPAGDEAAVERIARAVHRDKERRHAWMTTTWERMTAEARDEYKHMARAALAAQNEGDTH